MLYFTEQIFAIILILFLVVLSLPIIFYVLLYKEFNWEQIKKIYEIWLF